MTRVAMDSVEKCRRILESLESRDTSSIGYEAQLRHEKRLGQARQTYEKALAQHSQEVSTATVGHPSDEVSAPRSSRPCL